MKLTLQLVVFVLNALTKFRYKFFKFALYIEDFFLLYRQKDIDKIIEGNDRNYVIDKLTCEIMENKPLGSRM